MFDEDKDKLSAFLLSLGAAAIKHGNRTLYHHLMGCYNLAVELKQPKDIALACGVHSVYGTSYFKHVTTLDRVAVTNAVGANAEHLAWLFCLLRREDGWLGRNATYRVNENTTIHLSLETLCKVKIMEIINLHEQWDA